MGKDAIYSCCDLGRTPVVLLLPGSPCINIQAIYLELVYNVFKRIHTSDVTSNRYLIWSIVPVISVSYNNISYTRVFTHQQ